MTDYQRPDSVAGVVAALAETGDGYVLAGGTDLMNEIRLGIVTPRRVVDLAAVSGLGDVAVTAAGVAIGAAVTMRQIRELEDPHLLGALRDAARLLGGRQMQTVATVGGNLCHASPAAETATPMLVHDAVARVAGPDGERSFDVADLWAGPRRTTLAPGELVVGFTIGPSAARWASAYQRIELRHSVDIAIASASVALDVVDGAVASARVALGALGPVAFRVPEAERILVGATLDGARDSGAIDSGAIDSGAIDSARIAAAAEACVQAARPIDDVRASAAYRRAMAGVVMARAAAAAAARSMRLTSA